MNLEKLAHHLTEHGVLSLKMDWLEVGPTLFIGVLKTWEITQNRGGFTAEMGQGLTKDQKGSLDTVHCPVLPPFYHPLTI